MLARNSTDARQMSTTKHCRGCERQVSVVQPAPDVCVAGIALSLQSPGHRGQIVDCWSTVVYTKDIQETIQTSEVHAIRNFSLSKTSLKYQVVFE